MHFTLRITLNVIIYLAQTIRDGEPGWNQVRQIVAFTQQKIKLFENGPNCRTELHDENQTCI